MATIQQQALGIINVCKAAFAGKGGDQRPVDNQTIAIAQAILEEAKKQVPDDRVLAAVNLEPPVPFWTTVQSAMEMVMASIPAPEALKLGERMEKARKRVEATEQPIQDAIASYKAALAEYERLAQTESPSYSIIEISKLKVADAFLESRGIPTAPRSQEKIA